jgi:hypothetical protein
VQKPPSLRNNNGSLQVRVRIDGKDHFINCLGHRDDPVAVAMAQAISAQIAVAFSVSAAGALLEVVLDEIGFE